MEQFYFVIAVLVIGFLNWLVKVIQERRGNDDAEKLRREMEALDPELRAEVERRNTQVQPRPPQPQPQPSGRHRHPQAPPQQESDQDEPNPLRKIMGELLGIPEQQKSAPPPIPQQAPAHQRTARAETSRQKQKNEAPRELTAVELAAADAFRHADTKRGRRRKKHAAGGSNASSIRKLISEPGGLQKAVILREILGPPQSMKG